MNRRAVEFEDAEAAKKAIAAGKVEYLGRETTISVLENAEELDRTAKRKLKREKFLEGV